MENIKRPNKTVKNSSRKKSQSKPRAPRKSSRKNNSKVKFVGVPQNVKDLVQRSIKSAKMVPSQFKKRNLSQNLRNTVSHAFSVDQSNAKNAEEKYIEAILNPGVHKIIPPFNDITAMTGVIPLILNASSYVKTALTPYDAGALGRGLNNAPIGQVLPGSEYTVILLCPIATAFGKGINGVSSGVYIRQSFSVGGSVGASINYESMSTLFPGQANSNSFFSPLSITDAWGSDMSDIGIHGNCFSIEAKIQIIASQANLSGVYWTGHVPLGSILNDDGAELALRFDEMIKMGKSHKITSEIILNEYIRNPNSLVEIHRNGSSTVDLGSILGECVTYAIIPNAVIPVAISGQTSSVAPTLPYSIALSLSSNWVVWPKRTPAGIGLTENNPGANKFYKSSEPVHKGHSLQLSGKLHKLSNSYILKNSEKSFAGKAWDWLKDIDWKYWSTLALELAPMLLADEDIPNQTIINPIDVNVNLFGNMPPDYSLQDPEPNEIIQAVYELKNKWAEWYSTHNGYYVYPAIKWTPASELAVPNDKKATWWNLLKDTNHPSIQLDLAVDFVLCDNSKEAKLWFNEFIIYYQPSLRDKENADKPFKEIDSSFRSIKSNFHKH